MYVIVVRVGYLDMVSQFVVARLLSLGFLVLKNCMRLLILDFSYGDL